MTPTPEARRLAHMSTAALDRDLLLLALDAMIKRFLLVTKDAGYSEDFINTATESEIALAHRIRQRSETPTPESEGASRG